MFERRTVSLFDHQVHPTVGYDPQQYLERYGIDIIYDIASKGYNEIVLCITELDMASDERTQLLVNLVTLANHLGLLVTADPWRVGGIFGGEGFSFYEQNGGKPCTCETELEEIIYDWLDLVSFIGIKRVFWDEAELQCSRNNPDDTALNLLRRLTRRAVSKGITWNSSCIRSRESSVDMADIVAALPEINEIAVAPYPFHPDSKKQKSSLEVVDSIAPWFRRIKAAADKHGITSQAWMQGFNISPENLHVLEVYLNQIEIAGIGNLAVWGYNGCKSIPDLNPITALPPEVTWAEVSRLVEATRQRG